MKKCYCEFVKTDSVGDGDMPIVVSLKLFNLEDLKAYYGFIKDRDDISLKYKYDLADRIISMS